MILIVHAHLQLQPKRNKNWLYPLKFRTRQNFDVEDMINHNSWTDRAGKPVKTFLDAKECLESNELDTNIPIYLEFLRKIYICAFAVLIFWKFSKKIKNSFPASHLAFPIRYQAKFLTCEISDFTPCAHLQSNMLHMKYAKKIDD